MNAKWAPYSENRWKNGTKGLEKDMKIDGPVRLIHVRGSDVHAPIKYMRNS